MKSAPTRPFRRVVITGMGVISPLGNTIDSLWDSLQSGRSGVRRISGENGSTRAIRWGGVANDFSGKIDDFGQLDPPRRKAIRKGLKLMCREIKMGVAAAQLALQHSELLEGELDSDRTGVVYGCDHIVSLPEEFTDAYSACLQSGSGFEFSRWGTEGLSQVTPLWLLKYLPNMPASHIAIYNDLRGPNNSLTYREPSANYAIGEAFTNIRRGIADRMIAGATGSSVGPLRSIQTSIYSELAVNGETPETACRPFDQRRTGSVAGEGAAALLLEEYELARQRGATIYGEVLGHGSSVVASPNGVADIRQSVINAAQAAIRNAGFRIENLGHVHAHGNGTLHSDREEALAIQSILGKFQQQIPVTAAKSYFGNLGAASGIVELISSLLAIRNGRLFPILNCDSPDPDCPIRLARPPDDSPGSSVLNLNFSPNGQSSALLVEGTS